MSDRRWEQLLQIPLRNPDRELYGPVFSARLRHGIHRDNRQGPVRASPNPEGRVSRDCGTGVGPHIGGTRHGADASRLDLRADRCTRIGAPTDVVQARNHAAGRAFGKVIHASHEDVDGLVYSSRLTGEDVYAIYERSVRKLNVGEVGQLEEHVELPDVLERHGIGLLV